MEKDFITELMRAVDHLAEQDFGHGYKIPDLPVSQIKTMRFTPKKPYDLFWLYQDVYHAIECKQETGLSLAWKVIADHQEDALLAVERQGGCGWLVVNFRSRLSARQQKLRGQETLNLAFAVRIVHALHARNVECYPNLPLDWWEQNGIRLPSMLVPTKPSGAVKAAWDPRPLAGAIASCPADDELLLEQIRVALERQLSPQNEEGKRT